MFTPLPLDRVIADPALRAAVQDVLDRVPKSTAQTHGITMHRKGVLPRALVMWGDFPADGDGLAKRIRTILGATWEVSQAGPATGWGKFRTATVDNPYRY